MAIFKNDAGFAVPACVDVRTARPDDESTSDDFLRAQARALVRVLMHYGFERESLVFKQSGETWMPSVMVPAR